MDYSLFDSACKDCGCSLKINEPMKKHTTFKIGGPATRFVTVYNENQLKTVVSAATKFNIRVFMLGKGSNLLIDDNGIDAVVIKLDGDFKEIKLVSPTKIYAPAGASLASLGRFALENSLTGLEFSWGIPGSVGGAVYMNAGAYGGEMKDVVSSVSFMLNGEINKANSDNLSFSYRKSRFTNSDEIILGAEFQLKQGNHEEIHLLMEDLMNKRKTKQPYDMPSAGSVFKRPEGYFAAALIEESGLKGASVGGAMVSEKHSGFIINKENATCQDVVELIKKVQETVWDKKQVKLECEVKVCK